MGELLNKTVYGCYLLTCSAGEEINGMPLSLFLQVSFQPPVVAVGVSPKRYTHKMILESGAFAVVFLRKEQKPLVERFKLKSEERSKKFEGLEWERGITGAPILKDCLGYIECRLIAWLGFGDHTLFIGEVVKEKLLQEGEVLSVSDLGKYYAG